MINRNRQKGFTIIELLLAMVFFSFILMFATASYIRINRTYVRGANIKTVQQETRKVLAELTSAIREAGASEITIIDEDNENFCNLDTKINSDGFDADLTQQMKDCRHRFCIGDKRYAWNQGFKRPAPDVSSISSEHSWFSYVTKTGDGFFDIFGIPDNSPINIPWNILVDNKTDPFAMVKSSTKEGCVDNIVFSETSDIVDSKKILVQDIDVESIDNTGNSFRVTVSLSTYDDNPDDNQDLRYESIDEGGGFPEYKARECFTDQGSQQFCYVYTLSTIVTVR